MALMPDGQPFSVPDPLADAWDDMVRRNDLLQMQNDPLGIRSSQPLQASGATGGGGGLRQVANENPAPARPIDPATTDVFPRGPDGRLHPLPGWHTTGPLDVGKWVHNVNWGGVADDFSDIGIGMTGWFLPPALGWRDKAAVIGSFLGMGKAAAKDADRSAQKAP